MLLLAQLFGCATTPSTKLDYVESYEEEYPLDYLSRDAPGSGAPTCPVVQLLEYEGDIIRYHRPLRVNPYFREKLQHFEALVAEVALQVYGRSPDEIRHAGAYLCRRIHGRPRLSEHGLGNAIDVMGFVFYEVGDGRFEGEFTVSVLEDWDARGSRRAHARFLRLLASRLVERPDIFRVMLGPGAPGHDDHFHLDMAPWRFVNIQL